MAAASRALSLYDVEDAEAFVASIVHGSGLELSYHDAEDCRAYMVAVCWELSLRYDPAAGGISFSSWAGATLRRRLVDWQRARYGRTRWQFSGRTYERPLPKLVSFDDPDERDRLDPTLAGSGLDRGELDLADELRALQARGRRPGRRAPRMGGAAA